MGDKEKGARDPSALRSVLIVDDDLSHLRSTSRMLKPYIPDIVTASTFDEAVALVRKRAFDAALLDLFLTPLVSLGHASDAITLASYAAPGSADEAALRKGLALLQGGGKK